MRRQKLEVDRRRAQEGDPYLERSMVISGDCESAEVLSYTYANPTAQLEYVNNARALSCRPE